MTTLYDLDKASVDNIAYYLNITDYIALIQSCSYMHYLLNINDNQCLYRTIIVNSVRRINIANRFISIISYNNTPLLHGTNIVYDNNIDVVNAEYDRGVLVKSIVKDNRGFITSVYLKDIGDIKIKYEYSGIYIKYRRLICRIDNGKIVPWKYVKKLDYAKLIYVKDGLSYKIINRLGDTKEYDITDEIANIFDNKVKYTLPVIIDVLTNNIDISKLLHTESHYNTLVSSGEYNIYDKYGNVKLNIVDNKQIKYKNNRIVKELINTLYEKICNNYKYDVKVYITYGFSQIYGVYNGYHYCEFRTGAKIVKSCLYNNIIYKTTAPLYDIIFPGRSSPDIIKVDMVNNTISNDNYINNREYNQIISKLFM